MGGKIPPRINMVTKVVNKAEDLGLSEELFSEKKRVTIQGIATKNCAQTKPDSIIHC